MEGKTILLVEADAALAASRKTAPEAQGYSVRTEPSGMRAVAAFGLDPSIDLVLMDLDPGAGRDGAEAAKSVVGLRKVPVIFLSSHDEPSAAERADRVASYGFLAKDAGISALDASIRVALRLFEAQRRLEEDESRYHALVELAVDGILLGTNEGIVCGANEVMCSILGMPREEILGKHVRELPFTPESVAKAPWRFDLLVAGETVVSERVIARPDGSEAIVEMHTKMMPDGSYQSIYRDVSLRRRDEERIRSLLAEKELILKEVHHRVKNNMFIMTRLLSLQADRSPEPGSSALKEAEGRIRSMVLLYDRLYESADFRRVSSAEYLASLVEDILANFATDVGVRADTAIDDFSLDAKHMQTIGIIVNELLTNAMKYAFAGRRTGTIRVEARRLESAVALTVRDDGIGLPEGLDARTSGGFGLTLVRELTSQLKGIVRIERGGGTAVTVEFPLQA